MFEASWSGSYPTLCHGEWTILKNGEDVSAMIPLELKSSEMNTLGQYDSFHFDDNWSEVWEEYTDGLNCVDWIQANSEWISQICDSYTEKVELFTAIQENDWRHGSCGGCI